MSFRIKSLSSILLILFNLIALQLMVSSVFAQFPVLEIWASDSSDGVASGQQDIVISVYMKNWQDTVAAFVVTLATDHPDVVEFQTGFPDAAGTLVSGWQYISTSPISEGGLKITAVANMMNPPYQPGIGYPQTGEIPLIKVLANIGSIPDTMETNIINLSFLKNIADFQFSDQKGRSIGLGYDSTFDTVYYNCLQWTTGPLGDSLCLDWEEVPGPPADTVIVGYIYHDHYLDTTKVYIYDSQIVIKDCLETTGDADYSGSLNVLDIVYVINYLYKNGAAPYYNADCNCDCVINLLDINCLISTLYNTGWPCTCCTCDQWESNCGGNK